MTKKNNNMIKPLNKVKQDIVKLQNKLKQVPGLGKTPLVRHPMETIGGLAGPVGRSLGKGIGRIIGSGDYVVSGNSLSRSSAVTLGHGSVPSFAVQGDGSIRVTHREYIGNVVSGPANTFSLSAYVLNPGLIQTFPWLRKTAIQYDQWRPNGIVVSFVSSSSSYSGGASQALGTVILATDYDLNDPLYQDDIQMLNSEFCVSGKSDSNIMHPIECDPEQRPVRVLKVRTGSHTDNPQWYDLGTLQVATVGVPAANVTLGQLWITYDVTFMKEQLNPLGTGNLFATLYHTAGLANNATFGTALAPQTNNNLPVGFGPNTITFPSFITSGVFEVRVWYAASGTATLNVIVDPVLTNCIKAPASVYSFKTDGVTTKNSFIVWTIKITGPNATLNFGTGNTYSPTPTFVEVDIIELPPFYA